MRNGDRIKELFAYVILDESDDCEGIPAISGPGENGQILLMALVGADMEKMTSLEVRVKELAENTGKTIELRRFTTMETIKVIKP